MKPFDFVKPTRLDEALKLLESGAGEARIIAGGSDLLSELKEGTAHYECLISLAGIEELHEIRAREDGLHIGAMVSLSTLENDPQVAGPYRILSEAARGVATPEIRHQGTLGGNLCQRPRCLFYRNALTPCLKKGGSDCPALESPFQNYLSIMGGEGCYSANTVDLAPPLMVLQAKLRITGPKGERILALEDFYSPPERDVSRENLLAANEVLTAVILPPPTADWRGVYLKGRERTAGDFPLVSVAAGCVVEDNSMRQVRMVLGGVAPVPWPCPEAEGVLEGGIVTPELIENAARTAFADALPLPHNGFKAHLGRSLVARAVTEITA